MSDSKRFFFPVTAALVGVLLVLGVQADTPTSGERSSFEARCGNGFGNSTSIQSRNGRYDIKVKRGRCRLDVHMRGDVEFLPDESGIASMSRRARFEISEEIGRDKRRLVVTPGAGGKPVYEWLIDGRLADFSEDGRAWLRQTLPTLFRTTGIDAEARVGRILDREGIDGVLHEVKLISGDHTQGIYLRELFQQADLDESEADEALKLAGDEVSSDFELAELLINFADNFNADSLPHGFASAVATIGSDFEHRRVLEAALSRESVSPRLVADLLSTATAISSDFELAELLVKATRVVQSSEPLPDSFFTVLETISSDFEHRRVLSAALANRELTAEGARALLEASTSIGSDFEMAEFLISLGHKYPQGEAMPAAFERALKSVGSSFERQRVLAAVGKH